MHNELQPRLFLAEQQSAPRHFPAHTGRVREAGLRHCGREHHRVARRAAARTHALPHEGNKLQVRRGWHEAILYLET